MKKNNIISTAAIILGVFAISATPAKEETKQCGVTNAQIKAYLETCSHHHTVYSVWDIPGTCNSNASIENCGIATVYVSNGRVIGHMENSGVCD